MSEVKGGLPWTLSSSRTRHVDLPKHRYIGRCPYWSRQWPGTPLVLDPRTWEIGIYVYYIQQWIKYGTMAVWSENVRSLFLCLHDRWGRVPIELNRHIYILDCSRPKIFTVRLVFYAIAYHEYGMFDATLHKRIYSFLTLILYIFLRKTLLFHFPNLILNFILYYILLAASLALKLIKL